MGARMILGLDVSTWQDDNSTAQQMDFAKAKKAGANFVFIKASERAGVDADFLYNWKTAKAAGIPRGAYHFLRWDLSGAMQARVFCALLKDDPGELPPVADFEAPAKNGINPSNAILAEFLSVVESETGKVPIIYTSPGFWNSWGKIKGTSAFDEKWTYYPLWIAHYTTAKQPIVPKPWDKWTYWQYSSTGDGPKFGAESKNIDLNWFNGDLADLVMLAGDVLIEEPAIEKPDLIALKANVNAAIDAWAKDYF